jgi:hypothetical protein
LHNAADLILEFGAKTTENLLVLVSDIGPDSERNPISFQNRISKNIQGLHNAAYFFWSLALKLQKNGIRKKSDFLKKSDF